MPRLPLYLSSEEEASGESRSSKQDNGVVLHAAHTVRTFRGPALRQCVSDLLLSMTNSVEGGCRTDFSASMVRRTAPRPSCRRWSCCLPKPSSTPWQLDVLGGLRKRTRIKEERTRANRKCHSRTPQDLVHRILLLPRSETPTPASPSSTMRLLPRSRLCSLF
jgi:hypothetical protein